MKNENHKRNANKILSLNSSLKRYGLQPNEWIVRREGENIYRIQNTEAPDFYFEGRTIKQGKHEMWKKIYLKSI